MKRILTSIEILSAVISIAYYIISNFKENKFDKINYKIDSIYFLILYLCAMVSKYCI